MHFFASYLFWSHICLTFPCCSLYLRFHSLSAAWFHLSGLIQPKRHLLGSCTLSSKVCEIRTTVFNQSRREFNEPINSSQADTQSINCDYDNKWHNFLCTWPVSLKNLLIKPQIRRSKSFSFYLSVLRWSNYYPYTYITIKPNTYLPTLLNLQLVLLHRMIVEPLPIACLPNSKFCHLFQPGSIARGLFMLTAWRTLLMHYHHWNCQLQVSLGITQSWHSVICKRDDLTSGPAGKSGV